jgi:hypothetical protein
MAEVTGGEQREHLQALFDTLVRDRKPTLEHSIIPRFSKEILPLTALAVPFSADAGESDAALGTFVIGDAG